MPKKPSLSRRISHSTPPSTTRSRHHVEDDNYPSRGRRRHSVMGERRSRRGRSADSNDTYYDPRDKYYLTGSEDEGPARSRRRRGRSSSLKPQRRNHHRSSSSSSYASSVSRSPSPEFDRSSRRRKGRHHHSPAPSSRSSSPPAYSPRSSHAKSRGRSSHHEYAHPHSRSPSPTRRSKSASHRRHSSPPPPYSPRSTRSHSRSKSRNPFSRLRHSRSPSPPPPPPKQHAPPKTPSEMFMTATKIAVETAALTALKLRDDPSPLLGPKGGKIAAAALSAAVVDTFIDKKHPKVRKGGLRHTVIRQATQLAIGNIVGGGKGGKQKGVRGEGLSGKLRGGGRRR